MDTHILSIPYKAMRYASYGDYQKLADDSVEITVVALPDWRHEFLIALHEFIEEAVTRHRGIKEPDILAFDLAHLDSDDPGMIPSAPYHQEHVLATAVEMLVARELGVDWTEYGKACEGINILDSGDTRLSPAFVTW